MTRVALGIPARPLPDHPDHVVDWAVRAEAGPFTSVAVGDRVVSRGHEALIVLGACAAATKRVRLLAALVVGPIRETTLLARQAATLDAISGGRLTLGLGVGARTDDYDATGTPFAGRGARAEEQLARLRRIWRGEPAAVGEPVPIGAPAVRRGGPEVLLGGYVPAVADRIAAHADGLLAPGGADDAAIAALWRAVEAAWASAGRAGSPRLVTGSYVALGPSADEAADRYIGAYYGYDPAVAARRRASLPTTPDAVRETLRRMAGLGADEVILRPVEADPTMVDRLAELLGGDAPG
jgi:alkanesulfonate monooxygenase SsuD/methylene tetrahydromethanopterin reductase-like flavin-dependent oxidoreductase (luciferase family)